VGVFLLHLSSVKLLRRFQIPPPPDARG
jgi:hypothetical protein